MSKYEPLTQHLSARSQQRIAMQFMEIEKVLGFPLPPSARKHRAWWSNNPSNSVMTKAWLDAGYHSEQVDLEAERLVFARLNEVEPAGPQQRRENAPHPLIGCMTGTFTIAPGVDLTAPTQSDWEEATLQKFDRLLGKAT